MFMTATAGETSLNFFDWLTSFFGELSTTIIIIFLSLDSIRWVISTLGIVNPNAKYAWIIYGKYDRQLLRSVLKDLGFSHAQQDFINRRIHSIAEEVTSNDVTKENAAIQLVILLAKYIVKLPTNSKYGVNTPSKSEYYIDTMEASHDRHDLSKMVSIMKFLIEGSGTSPNIIITPKGGNVVLAKDVAYLYSAHYLMAKDFLDSSKLTAEDKKIEFMVNYEGSFGIIDSSNSNVSIVVDCNTSGGGQLLNIIRDIADRRKDPKCTIGVPVPQNAFVLFRVDDSKKMLSEEFINNKCPLIRFFDLDEETKKQLYSLKTSSSEPNKPNYYYATDRERAQKILDSLDQKRKLFYKNGVLTDESTVGSC